MMRLQGRVLRMVVLTAAGVAGSLAQNMAGGGASALVWPAQGEYVGSKQCAVCHPKQSEGFHSNSMSRALEPIENCEILKRNPRMEWTDGQYHYRIEQTGPSYLYRVSD